MKPGERILGVEGGGTKTAWVLVEPVVPTGGDDPAWQFHVIDQGKLPPSNFRLTTPERLRVIFAELPKQIDRAGVFLAGCGTEQDRRLLKEICLEIWPNAKIVTGSDRQSGLAAALDHGDGVVVNAGSGSSVTGRLRVGAATTSRGLEAGGTSWVTPAAVILSPFKRSG